LQSSYQGCIIWKESYSLVEQRICSLQKARHIMADEQKTETPARRKPGPRPGTEAAKRGGQAARAKYGVEYYSRIGKKGGSIVKERHGSDHYTRIGRQGGEQTKAKHGVEHYARIGRIGGMNRGRRAQPAGEDAR
jgi:general stress protein YciG